MIYHHLKKAGFAHTRIAREQALSGRRADVVLYGDGVAGDFVTTRKNPLVAIEVKGGAYGCRNALADEIDANGYCADMEKLKAEAQKGVECWFICVDMQELGRAVSPQKAKLVAEQCSAHVVTGFETEADDVDLVGAGADGAVALHDLFATVELVFL